MSATHPAGAGGIPAGLVGAQFVRLTTYRRDGTPVPTPVWFAAAGNRLYVATPAHSGKVKRVRAGEHVLVGPCTGRGELRGPEVAARARVLLSAEAGVARDALRRRNGFQARAGEIFYRLRGWGTAHMEITFDA